LEDILGSKQKDSRNFKENLVTFWDTIVRESQEGALFDQQLMEKCMDHVIALSCTQPRVFRIVASLVGLQLVTSLVAVAKSLGQSRETAQRQLNAEKKKRKEGPRIESLNKILSEKHEKITMVEEMMRKMFTGLFMHRYRDVDPEIRQACISAMGSWIVSYPSLFLQDLYLKYIGWTLNDKVFLATISPGRL
jgi:cohesin complex subunit SA-1/2